jgi:methylmalonyl-CoA mutase C-terminal domain/subunit
MSKKIKVLLAKVGLDPHDKGIKLIAHGLRDIGKMEIIYTGLYSSLEEVEEIAMQNKVDIVGVSIHTGQQMNIFPQLRNDLDSRGGRNIVLIGGGVMPRQDIDTLKNHGAVAEIFEPATSIDTIIEWINKLMNEKSTL